MTNDPSQPSAPADPSAAPPAPKKTPIWVWFLALIPVALCCLGVFAAIAIPGFIRFVKRSKAQEAEMSLREMVSGTVRYCEETNQVPPAAGPMPGEGPDDLKRVADPAAHPGFVAIGFAPPGPVLYQYSIVPDGADVLLRVEGDIDADGLRSRYQARCNARCECVTDLPVEPLE